MFQGLSDDVLGTSGEHPQRLAKAPPPYPGRKLGYSGCLGEDNRRGQDKTEHTTRLVTPKGSADNANDVPKKSV